MCPSLLPHFFWVVLLGLPAPCLAQPSLPEDAIDLEGSDIKELAKAAFEANQTPPRDLARARFEAARTQLHERYRSYRRGEQDVPLDLLLEAVAPLAEAELAALKKPTPVDRQAALTPRWLFTLAAEQIVEAKYRVGRVSLADFMQARGARLDAEIKLREADAGKKLSAPFASSRPLDVEEPPYGLDAKDAAKRAFEAGQVDLRDLARARRDAARTAFEERYRKYVAGAQDATLDLLLKSVGQRAEAELAALDNPTPADRLEVLAARWQFALFTEWIVEAKHRVGRVSLADLMQARIARLESEIKLRAANAGRKLANPFLAPVPSLDPDAFLDPLAQQTAKRAFEAGQADLRDLARARRDTARTAFEERYRKYRAGAQDATLDLLLEASRQLLEVELAFHTDRAERLAAHERYWGQTRIAEEIVRAKYAVGRVGRADYAQVQFNRLDAEVRMREKGK